jgi:hypothetical protein
VRKGRTYASSATPRRASSRRCCATSALSSSRSRSFLERVTTLLLKDMAQAGAARVGDGGDGPGSLRPCAMRTVYASGSRLAGLAGDMGRR